MKNKKLYHLLATLAMTLAMTFSSVPVQAAECTTETVADVCGKEEYKAANVKLQLETKYPVENNELYTEETYKFYECAVRYGDYMLNKINASTEELQEALTHIEATKKNLQTCRFDEEKALSTAKLKFNILKTSQLLEEDYTGSSWLLLETALENAEEALETSSSSGILKANIEALKGCVLKDMSKINPQHVKDIFSDVKETAWYVPGVQFVYDYGFMSGSNGLFNPNADITRAQLVTTLYRMVGCPSPANRAALKDFSDIAENKYYTDAVCWAYAEGITTGNNGKFDPSGKLTRQQMAAFFYRFSEYLELDTETRGDFNYMLNADKTYSYAKDPVAWAVGSGYISGSNVNVNGVAMKDLNPRGNTTRAQVATIIMRFCEVN